MCAYDYVHLSMDEFRNSSQLYKEARKALLTHSVAVEDCFSRASSRIPYIALADELRIPIRILWHVRNNQAFPSVSYSKSFEDPRHHGAFIDLIY